jgi:hypothetical protein
MLYIKTSRGWRPLHKLHYAIAKSWRESGWDVEEHVANFDGYETWVSEIGFDYWVVMDRLVYGARQRAKQLGIPCSISVADFEIPKVCPLRHVPFRVGKNGLPTEDSPTLDRKDPRLGYVKENVWVISHKANRLKGDFTPDELKTFCENALALDWVTWTSDDEDAMRTQEAEWKRKMSEKLKLRWWALWGVPKSEVK